MADDGDPAQPYPAGLLGGPSAPRQQRQGQAMDGRQRHHHAASGSAGFTLVELVVSVGVLAVMAGWGLPAFGELTRDTARTREVNRFVQAIHLARSEAIKRDGVVSLCPSADGAICQPGPQWQSGWIVFVNLDRDSPASRDTGEPVVHFYQQWDAGRILSNRDTLSFRPFGQMGVTATVTFCDDRGSAAARAVIISQTGRPRTSSRSASNGPLDCT
jgi:type IV fimbrial biogenesis protein FimT